MWEPSEIFIRFRDERSVILINEKIALRNKVKVKYFILREKIALDKLIVKITLHEKNQQSVILIYGRKLHFGKTFCPIGSNCT